MSMYYICSRYRGTKEQIAEHIEYAKELTRETLLYGHCAITPHLYITNCLDDSDPEERQMGLEAALEILGRCDAVVVGMQFGISEGMATEIAEAKRLGIPVFYRDKEERNGEL